MKSSGIASVFTAEEVVTYQDEFGNELDVSNSKWNYDNNFVVDVNKLEEIIKYIDEDGNSVDVEYVDEDGNPVDKDGNPLD